MTDQAALAQVIRQAADELQFTLRFDERLVAEWFAAHGVTVVAPLGAAPTEVCPKCGAPATRGVEARPVSGLNGARVDMEVWHYVRPVLPEGDRAARYHEIRLDADGKPDDIVLQCDSVQLERCDDGVWFFCASRGGKRTALFLSKVGRNVVANVTENELNAPEVGLRAGRTEQP